jgi:hypothetical protein
MIELVDSKDRRAAQRQSFAVTTGTGSGKSLCFFVPIIDAAIRARAAGEPARTRAIVIYPMNALANSQLKELEKFIEQCGLSNELRPSFARYTGQESQEERDRIKEAKPDILLTKRRGCAASTLAAGPARNPRAPVGTDIGTDMVFQGAMVSIIMLIPANALSIFFSLPLKLAQVLQAIVAGGTGNQRTAGPVMEQPVYIFTRNTCHRSKVGLRDLASQQLPPLVRSKIIEYGKEKAAGPYGRSEYRPNL